MKYSFKVLSILFLSATLFGCQTSQIKQKEIIYQIENDRVIKFILNEDKITKIGLRELKKSFDYGNRELLLEEYKKDVEIRGKILSKL